ncbi:MAG: zinc ribbon domain-containing protein [Croceitalea sp.]|nr:zinc ribbon domain-containing protein [Croceitalea sp.]
MLLTHRLLFLLFIIGQVAIGQEWIKTAVGDIATIDFPVTSDNVESQGETLYAASTDEAAFVVSLRMLSPEQIAQITEDQVPNLYEGVAQGALDAANGALRSQKEIDVDGMPGLELEYLVAVDEELSSLRYKRMVYSEPYIIQMDFWPLTGRQGVTDENKDRFFNSFAFGEATVDKAAADSVASDTPISTASEIGYYVGVLIFVLMVLGLIVGLVVLLLYIRRKRNRSSGQKKTTTIAKPKVAKVKCTNCETENASSSKYCKQCGYALSKDDSL